MTENDNIKRSKGKFDPVTETRPWAVAASEEYCQRIARNTSCKLIEIIETDDDVLPIVCIFKELEK